MSRPGGMSAAEREVRDMVERIDARPSAGLPSLSDQAVFALALGTLRDLLRDMDLWRRIAERENALSEIDPLPHDVARGGRMVAVSSRDIVHAILELLPDDDEQRLALLAEATRMVRGSSK